MPPQEFPSVFRTGVGATQLLALHAALAKVSPLPSPPRPLPPAPPCPAPAPPCPAPLCPLAPPRPAVPARPASRAAGQLFTAAQAGERPRLARATHGARGRPRLRAGALKPRPSLGPASTKRRPRQRAGHAHRSRDALASARTSSASSAPRLPRHLASLTHRRASSCCPTGAPPPRGDGVARLARPAPRPAPRPAGRPRRQGAERQPRALAAAGPRGLTMGPAEMG